MSKGVKELLKAILSIEDEKVCKSFFEDLCSPKELESMAERWKTVALLDQEIPYRKISEMTGASTATITRVAKCLKRKNSGYRQVLEDLEK